MEKNTQHRPPIIFPPPLIFFALLGIGFLLDFLFPLKLYGGPWLLRIIGGAVLFLISGLLALTAFWVLLNNKTPFDPSKPTVVIVQDGPFRISRNPMYLSLLILLLGVAVLTGSLWMFLAVPLLFLIFDIGAVKPEEDYLARNFGHDYLAYKARVRRWL
jgi:protein-S-isoprenylcysteine O-methyltransferase Ste14